jgi:hypothetical protein
MPDNYYSYYHQGPYVFVHFPLSLLQVHVEGTLWRPYVEKYDSFDTRIIYTKRKIPSAPEYLVIYQSENDFKIIRPED